MHEVRNEGIDHKYWRNYWNGETSDGYKPNGESFLSLLRNMDVLKAEGMPLWDFIELDELLDSSNMTVGEWNKR